ncbi:MAG TPA: glycerophosphodiester phosphodiesterase [Solirubrobacteraceae bacterium]|nr:glycerophosphodiester phosphodiesterase [Solirubrobacteraceae bacterium]
MAIVVLILARAVSVLCVLVIASAVLFDAQVERLTSGRVPAESARPLPADERIRYADITGVAHNAGDDLGAATKAAAYGVDAVEIDVRSSGGELLATHDAPIPGLEDLVFRGPSLVDAWEIARLRETVLLHLKERSPEYLDQIRRFLETRQPRHVIVQSADPATLRTVQRTMPTVERLLLILDPEDLAQFHDDPSLQQVIDGVSVRDSLLTRAEQAGFERRGLLTFAWTVNDERRVADLVAQGVDGIITERLDLMRLLGEQP